MEPRDRLHPFLFTIPALMILACDPAEEATRPSDEDIVDEGTTVLAHPVASAPANPEGYEFDEDELPAKARAEYLAASGQDHGQSEDEGQNADKSPGPDPTGYLVAGVPTIGPTKDLLVAMVGDMGTGSAPKSVYKLILAEKADFAIITGDFDYTNSPGTFTKELTAGLGADFPVFAAVGNHDVKSWKGYQADFKARLAKIPGAVCTGDLGVDASCTYRGLHFVLSGVGTIGSKAKHEDYIAQALAADHHPWSLCVWHKNMRDLQAGDKPDEAGWTAFEHCQADGAIIVMGHEHSYARTRTLTDISNTKDHGATGMPELLEVGPGSTFTVVSGLGGKGIRAWDSGIHKSDTWWGTIYTSNFYRKNGVDMKKTKANEGALFLRFNVDGDPSAAQGYFKSVDGDVIDEFDIVRK